MGLYELVELVSAATAGAGGGGEDTGAYRLTEAHSGQVEGQQSPLRAGSQAGQDSRD